MSGCEQEFVVGPGCGLVVRVREDRPAGRARGGGLAGACQGRIVVVVGFGWAGPQLEPPTPPIWFSRIGFALADAQLPLVEK